MDRPEEMGDCGTDCARAASARLRVLVVAESRLVAEALMFSLETDPNLEAIGYALDGWEALDYMTTLKPDVVVAGPRVAALETLRFSQFARELFPDMLLIALCDRLVPEEAQSAYAAGVDDYLPLARSVEQLLRSISDARLRRHTFERGLRRAVHRPTLSLVPHGEVDAHS